MSVALCPSCGGGLSEVRPDFDGAKCVPCGAIYTNTYLAGNWWGVSPEQYAAEARSRFAAAFGDEEAV